MYRFFLSILTVAVFAAAIFLHPPGQAYACSCMAPPPAAESRDNADAVFSGTVVAVSEADATRIDGQKTITFEMLESWKGPVGETLTIHTTGSSASCGYEFVAGTDYLVYANVAEGAFSTNLCSRTAPLANAAGDVQELGAGQTPPPSEPAAEAPAATPEAGFPWLPVVGGVAVVALAGIAYATTRRRAA